MVDEGFIVLPYIHADPVLAKNLEDAGCATVMPLGSAIGSGQGIHTQEEVRIIIEQANVPVVVDAGLAVPSNASEALEMGADAVLVNTAIAQANDPALIGRGLQGWGGSWPQGLPRRAYRRTAIRCRQQSYIRRSPAGCCRSVAGASCFSMAASLELPCLCLVTDSSVVGPGELVPRVAAAVAGGVSLVQVRDKELPGGRLLSLVEELQRVIHGPRPVGGQRTR